MLRIFCCRSRKTSRVEIDRITDSLETCLSDNLGISEFEQFLIARNFQEERRTLEFVVTCKNTLRDISKLSPGTRAGELPDNIRTAISRLSQMTNDINFSSYQMHALENLNSNDIEEKVKALKNAEGWATDLLQDIYKVFRREAFRGV